VVSPSNRTHTVSLEAITVRFLNHTGYIINFGLHILDLVLHILVIFLLGICVGLQKFNQSTDVEDLLFLSLELMLLLLEPILESLHSQACLGHPFQLNLKEGHVGIAISHVFQTRGLWLVRVRLRSSTWG
jgi:hypothetical protein